jgi:hypothetical protein
LSQRTELECCIFAIDIPQSCRQVVPRLATNDLIFIKRNVNGNWQETVLQVTPNKLLGFDANGALALVDPAQAGGACGQGLPGADGKTVRNGAGVPAPALGSDGDFYIDTAAQTIYGPKASGLWGTPTNIIGPQGAQGAAGASRTTGTARAVVR